MGNHIIGRAKENEIETAYRTSIFPDLRVTESMIRQSFLKDIPLLQTARSRRRVLRGGRMMGHIIRCLCRQFKVFSMPENGTVETKWEMKTVAII